MTKVTKTYEVLTRSFINNSIQEGGSLVTIEHEEDFKPGPNLKEHVPETKKAAAEPDAKPKTDDLYQPEPYKPEPYTPPKPEPARPIAPKAKPFDPADPTR